MGREKPRQAGGDRGLKSERTTHANKPPGLRLHPERRLLGSFRFNYGCARVFKDLLSDLGQVHASGRAIEEPYAEPLFQHRHAATDARLGKTKRTGSSRETAMLDDGGEKLQVIKIPHHCPRSFPLGFGSFRRPPSCMIDRETGLEASRAENRERIARQCASHRPAGGYRSSRPSTFVVGSTSRHPSSQI